MLQKNGQGQIQTIDGPGLTWIFAARLIVICYATKKSSLSKTVTASPLAARPLFAGWEDWQEPVKDKNSFPIRVQLIRKAGSGW